MTPATKQPIVRPARLIGTATAAAVPTSDTTVYSMPLSRITCSASAVIGWEMNDRHGIVGISVGARQVEITAP